MGAFNWNVQLVALEGSGCIDDHASIPPHIPLSQSSVNNMSNARMLVANHFASLFVSKLVFSSFLSGKGLIIFQHQLVLKSSYTINFSEFQAVAYVKDRDKAEDETGIM